MRRKQALYQMSGVPSDFYILVHSNTTLKDCREHNLLLTILWLLSADGYECSGVHMLLLFINVPVVTQYPGFQVLWSALYG